ncbi:MAG: helix-turn-helix domain-containing protein [Halioglobus sp.]
MSDLEHVSSFLADNITALRKRGELSQERLAQKAGIPRSTLTHMESGSGNPSLTNLCKLAAALGVGIEELLSRPRNECSLLKQDKVPIQKRSAGKVEVHKLMPDRVRGIEIDRMVFNNGASMAGKPHLQGTKEYLVGLAGATTVSVAGQHWEVNEGDVLAFPGDQKHGYRNTGQGAANALSIVLPMPYPTAKV